MCTSRTLHSFSFDVKIKIKVYQGMYGLMRTFTETEKNLKLFEIVPTYKWCLI